MSNQYVTEGKTSTFVAPVGGVTAWTPVVIEDAFVLPMETVDATESFEAYTEGVWQIAKATGFVPVAGGSAYFNDTSAEIEGTDASDNRRVGYFTEAALTGATSCYIKVDGTAVPANSGDLEAKIDKLASPTAGNLVSQTAGGGIQPLGMAASDVASVGQLASSATGYGSALIGSEDAGDYFDSPASQEAINQFVGSFLTSGDRVPALKEVEVVIASSASSGSSAADPDCVGGKVYSIVPVSGNDQVIASHAVAVDGAVTLTTAVVETAEATFRVLVALDF